MDQRAATGTATNHQLRGESKAKQNYRQLEIGLSRTFMFLKEVGGRSNRPALNLLKRSRFVLPLRFLLYTGTYGWSIQ